MLPRSGLVIVVLLSVAGGVDAQVVADTKRPLSWAELIDCEVVVLAKYKSHDKDQLVLEAVRFLKSPTPAEAGARLEVSLQHRYSVEMKPLPLHFSWRDKVLPDGAPKLCYRDHVAEDAPQRALVDLREPALYFFPRAESLVLMKRRQVQSALLADGWAAALVDKPTPVWFRLAQEASDDLRDEAIAELRKGRDRATLARLVGWIADPPLRDFDADEILAGVGDRGGDVYDPVWKQFEGGTTAAKAATVRAAAPLIARLGEADFAEREEATRQLFALGEGALDQLRLAARDHRDAEVRRRAGDLVTEVSEHIALQDHFSRLGALLVQLDEGRAVKDYAVLLKDGLPSRRRIAVRSLAQARTAGSLEVLFAALRDETLADDALTALRQLDNGDPRKPMARSLAEQLRAAAKPLLKAALADPGVERRCKAALRNSSGVLFAGLAGTTD